jgi:glutamyl-tRNA(Gln) amidotransferase subunit E
MPKVLLGKNIIDRPVYWEIEKEKNPHLLVLGTSGCGKTETLKAIIHDLNKANCPSMIIDFHNEFSGVGKNVLNMRQVGTKDSFIETELGKVHLQEMQLEEESATKIKEEGASIHYRLDRMGIPLIELSSAPEIYFPKQAKEFAETLGHLLRSLKVQRGIGTIRQDLNISIKGGARIEVKGFQDLKVLDKVIENEVERQLDLLKIKGLLEGRQIEFYEADMTDFFKDSGSKILRSLSKEKVLALKSSGLSGLFKEPCGKITLGKEIANYAKVFGIGGMIHSDEDLDKYGMSKEEQEKIRKELKVHKSDHFLIIGGKNSSEALEVIKMRIGYLQKGIPEETRFVDGENTRYARKLPGSARMYPEPDLPKVPLKAILKDVKLPQTLDTKAEAFEKMGISKEQAVQISRSKYLQLFESFIERYQIEPRLIADIILNKKKALERQGKTVTDENLEFVLAELSKNKISKKAVEDVLTSGSIKGFERISGKELEKLAGEYKARFGNDAAKELMKKYGKCVESEEVFKLLK